MAPCQDDDIKGAAAAAGPLLQDARWRSRNRDKVLPTRKTRTAPHRGSKKLITGTSTCIGTSRHRTRGLAAGTSQPRNRRPQIHGAGLRITAFNLRTPLPVLQTVDELGTSEPRSSELQIRNLDHKFRTYKFGSTDYSYTVHLEVWTTSIVQSTKQIPIRSTTQGRIQDFPQGRAPSDELVLGYLPLNDVF